MNNQKQLPVLFILQAKNDLHLSKTEHTLMLNGVRFLKPDLIIFLKSLPSAPEGILTNPMDVFVCTELQHFLMNLVLSP